MAIRYPLLAFLAAAFGVSSGVAQPADATKLCDGVESQEISFIQFQSPDLAAPPALLTIKGKLSLPKPCKGDNPGRPNKRMGAVLILHDSGGVDARGDFYERALNREGLAVLQIDMWEARGVTGIANRPQAPILTHPDAFSALAFLAAHPRIDARRIGVLGFSWGGVMSLAAAEQLYSGLFGGGLRFAAHVANYPVCWGANNTSVFPSPALAGTQFISLTGAPVLIQIGSEDDYDNGTAHCRALAQSVNPSNNGVVEVAEYENAHHGWDRIMIPITVQDPFADEGSFFSTGIVPNVQIVPDVEQAHESRVRVVKFFKKHL